MNKEVYVNIKISMPNGSDMSFSDEEIKEIQDYYEKEFSNFDYLVGEINVSFVDEKTKQIDQLKQQLAEKDTRIADLEDKDWYEACIKQLEEQNNRLIDTLKEKDKEIEKLRFDVQRYANDYREIELNKKIGMEHLAINELETVKYLLNIKAISVVGTGVDAVRLYTINEVINQRIKELKGEKE